MSKTRYIVYKLYDQNKNIIYIGRSSRGKERIKRHVKKGIYKKVEWKEEICYYSFCELNSESDMLVLEVYLINKSNPRYNKSDKGKGNLNIEIKNKSHWNQQIFSKIKSVETLNIDIDREKVAQYETQKEWDGATNFAKELKKKIEEYQNYTEKELKEAVNNLPQ